MNLDDTIVAIATPPGCGGIGVVRIAGPGALTIAKSLLRLTHELQPRRAIFGELIDADTQERIDEVVVTWFQKPHSYTTDDIVEISGHGSPIVLRAVVERCLERGARLAEPGEFTMRAFLNGRLDLTQAEAVRDLIEAQTLFQAKSAAQQLEGAMSKRLQPIKLKVIELIAQLEAGIDFAEDDINITPDADILRAIAALRAPLAELAKSFSFGKLVHDGITLAIVGRPNVGKSSLFNRLVEAERAIVTEIPGTTRDLVAETVAIDGIPIKLIDTAGLREAADRVEQIGVQKTREALADADVVVIVLAPDQQDAEHFQSEMAEAAAGRAHIAVMNKSDLPEARTAQANGNLIRTSALTGAGVDDLRRRIVAVTGADSAHVEPGYLTNARHHALVQDALRALAAAESGVKNKVPHEMLLLDIYAALRALDAITGQTTSDDILHQIFSSFCIGK